MTNRSSRRSLDFKELVASTWTPWEWRNYLAGHELAPKGLRKCCLNNKYSVQFFDQQTDWGLIEHLMVRRHDSKPIRSWADLQRIKNELVGTDRTAIEVFPSENNVVDQANIYHLWILPTNVELPFGLHSVDRG